MAAQKFTVVSPFANRWIIEYVIGYLAQNEKTSGLSFAWSLPFPRRSRKRRIGNQQTASKKGERICILNSGRFPRWGYGGTARPARLCGRPFRAIHRRRHFIAQLRRAAPALVARDLSCGIRRFSGLAQRVEGPRPLFRVPDRNLAQSCISAGQGFFCIVDAGVWLSSSSTS